MAYLYQQLYQTTASYGLNLIRVSEPISMQHSLQVSCIWSLVNLFTTSSTGMERRQTLSLSPRRWVTWGRSGERFWDLNWCRRNVHLKLTRRVVVRLAAVILQASRLSFFFFFFIVQKCTRIASVPSFQSSSPGWVRVHSEEHIVVSPAVPRPLNSFFLRTKSFSRYMKCHFLFYLKNGFYTSFSYV